ncbi:MAG: CRISPR-associated endonuclease Cas1 [Elusimicrobiota bacterium]|nr:CRISPR-associated endonuclease Cas1 [Endomicrobiia bacterium]MDW8165536.1 CRISPR-associated endonuclease Cas1 [Elusimicrobiota bacterium]
MASLYITEDYAIIKKHQQRIVVQKEDKILLEIPSFKIDKILLFGKIQITADAVEWLLENNIDVAFFNQYGRLKAKLQNIESKNVYLRILQYETYQDEKRRLSIAKSIVKGKIESMINFIKRFHKNHPDISFDEEISFLEKSIELLERKQHIGGVLGVEGIVCSVYFGSFNKFLLNSNWHGSFPGRTKRPPRDPLNALLSLGYSLVTNELVSVLCGIGFDPYVGFLHEIDYGRPSLAVDLLEEFRVAVVDRVVVEMVNNKVISYEDFEYKENMVLMKKEYLKKFFEHFDRKLNTSFKDYFSGQELTYRKAFYNQAQKLAKAIRENISYESFRFL